MDLTNFLTIFKRNRLPKSGLLAYFSANSGMVDTVGVSSITFTTGYASNFINSTFQFDYDVTLAGIDADLGGGVLFTGTTPIARTWLDWYGLAAFNADYLWIGERGIAGYDTNQSENATRILRVLDGLTVDATVAQKYSGLDNYTSVEVYS